MPFSMLNGTTFFGANQRIFRHFRVSQLKVALVSLLLPFLVLGGAECSARSCWPSRILEVPQTRVRIVNEMGSRLGPSTGCPHLLCVRWATWGEASSHNATNCQMLDHHGYLEAGLPPPDLQRSATVFGRTPATSAATTNQFSTSSTYSL